MLLKGFWGRARPNDILELGGNDNFSAWFQYSDACNANCSFVSGDASVGFALIAMYFITKGGWQNVMLPTSKENKLRKCYAAYLIATSGYQHVMLPSL